MFSKCPGCDWEKIHSWNYHGLPGLYHHPQGVSTLWTCVSMTLYISYRHNCIQPSVVQILATVTCQTDTQGAKWIYYRMWLLSNCNVPQPYNITALRFISLPIVQLKWDRSRWNSGVDLDHKTYETLKNDFPYQSYPQETPSIPTTFNSTSSSVHPLASLLVTNENIV